MDKLVVVSILPAHRQHPRRFEDFKYVYPVLSRRSRGISIGINVNPDKVCNFDCIYCQVDRTVPSAIQDFNLALAEEELCAMLEIMKSGELAQRSRSIPCHRTSCASTTSPSAVTPSQRRCRTFPRPSK